MHACDSHESDARPEKCGGIVLCGGRSSRMGYDKAWLPFGDEAMLQRVVRLLGQAVAPVVVVAAPGQQLPVLPPQVAVVRDPQGGRGPLEGLLAGLAALAERPDRTVAAYATSCDAPLLEPALVRWLCGRRGTYEIVVPRENEFFHPLAAVYSTALVPAIANLLAQQQFRPAHLFERAQTLVVPVDELRAADGALVSLENVNTPAAYAAALSRCGFQAPADIAERLGI